MKTLYHGTIDKFVPSILKDGLKPSASNQWNAVSLGPSEYNPKIDDKHGFVFLSPRGSRAADYAVSKAEYFRAKPGDIFMLKGMSGMKMRKALDAPYIPDAKAAVLEVDVSDSVALDIDEHDAGGAFKYKGTLKPAKVKPIPLTEARKITDSPLDFNPMLELFLRHYGMKGVAF